MKYIIEIEDNANGASITVRSEPSNQAPDPESTACAIAVHLRHTIEIFKEIQHLTQDQARAYLNQITPNRHH